MGMRRIAPSLRFHLTPAQKTKSPSERGGIRGASMRRTLQGTVLRPGQINRWSALGEGKGRGLRCTDQKIIARLLQAICSLGNTPAEVCKYLKHAGHNQLWAQNNPPGGRDRGGVREAGLGRMARHGEKHERKPEWRRKLVSRHGCKLPRGQGLRCSLGNRAGKFGLWFV